MKENHKLPDPKYLLASNFGTECKHMDLDVTGDRKVGLSSLSFQCRKHISKNLH